MAGEMKKVKRKKRRWSKDDTELTLLALPTTIWYFLFCFMPMFGIVIATFGAPAVTGFITGNGYGMQAVFAVGVISALTALICMMLLGRELKRIDGSQDLAAKKEVQRDGTGNDEKTVRAGR